MVRLPPRFAHPAFRLVTLVTAPADLGAPRGGTASRPLPPLPPRAPRASRRRSASASQLRIAAPNRPPLEPLAPRCAAPHLWPCSTHSCLALPLLVARSTVDWRDRLLYATCIRYLTMLTYYVPRPLYCGRCAVVSSAGVLHAGHNSQPLREEHACKQIATS